MTIEIECELAYEPKLAYKEIIEKAVNAVLEYEACPYEAWVSVVITSDEEIHRINKEFREIDRATDVLSFPALEYEEPGEFGWLEEEEAYFHPETGELILGDIMLSIDHIEAQAEEYGHSLQRELAFLTVHSVLHLCGYDHMEEEERAVMEEKQRNIMKIMGINR